MTHSYLIPHYLCSRPACRQQACVSAVRRSIFSRKTALRLYGFVSILGPSAHYLPRYSSLIIQALVGAQTLIFHPSACGGFHKNPAQLGGSVYTTSCPTPLTHTYLRMGHNSFIHTTLETATLTGAQCGIFRRSSQTANVIQHWP